MSMSGDFNHKSYLDTQMSELVKQLSQQGIEPSGAGGEKPPRRVASTNEPPVQPGKGIDSFYAKKNFDIALHISQCKIGFSSFFIFDH